MLADRSRRFAEMCSSSLFAELCADWEKRGYADAVSWIPYVGVVGDAYLVKDSLKYDDYVGAGLSAVAIIPLPVGKLAKVAKVGKNVKLKQDLSNIRVVENWDDTMWNNFIGNAYRDHIAESFMARGNKVVTDATGRNLVTFPLPGGKSRVFDIRVTDKHGNHTYVETKSGNEGQDKVQAAKDRFLERTYGITITYVYDDLPNIFY